MRVWLILLAFALPAFAQDAARVQARLDEGGIWRSTETYTLEAAVFIRVPIAIIGPTFKAAKSIVGTRLGMIYAGYIDNVTLRDVTIDGNLAERQGAAYCNGTNDAYMGSNIHFDHIDRLSIDNVTTRNAVCGSGMHVIATNARIINSTFINNGLPGVANHWADGLTLLQCDQCLVADNLFQDATDISLVIGGARNSLITRNTIRQTVPAFAGLALDNFNNSRSGDFTGAIITANHIDCGPNCHFAMNIGPSAWYPSRNIRGGRISGNTIYGGQIGILAGGAGAEDAPLFLYGNDLVWPGTPGALARFSCGDRPTYAMIISPDSTVVTHGEKAIRTAHRDCP